MGGKGRGRRHLRKDVGASKCFGPSALSSAPWLFSPNPWQMMTFLNPLDALVPRISFSFFAEFSVRVTSGAWGSVSGGCFFGARELSFHGEGEV